MRSAVWSCSYKSVRLTPLTCAGFRLGKSAAHSKHLQLHRYPGFEAKTRLWSSDRSEGQCCRGTGPSYMFSVNTKWPRGNWAALWENFTVCLWGVRLPCAHNEPCWVWEVRHNDRHKYSDKPLAVIHVYCPSQCTRLTILSFCRDLLAKSGRTTGPSTRILLDGGAWDMIFEALIRLPSE